MALVAFLLFTIGFNSVRGQYPPPQSGGGGWGTQGGNPGLSGGNTGGGGECAVIIPDKVKGGKNHLCIPWKIVDKYMWEAILSLDLEAKLISEIERETGEERDVLAPGDYVEHPSNDYLHRLGEVLALVTNNLKRRFNLDKRAINEFLPKIDTSRTCIQKYCPMYLSRWDCIISKYMSFDGGCNNLHFPWYGMTNTVFKRFMSPAYDDMVIKPRNSVSGANLDLPSGRALSLLVHADTKRCDMTANMMHIWYGQMMNHEMTRKVGVRGLKCCDESSTGDMSNIMCYPITLHPTDEQYMEMDITCMSFTRSQCAVADRCRLGPMNQLNSQSGVIDGSAWYGPDKATADSFRLGMDGKLKVSAVAYMQDLLPGRDCDQTSGAGNTCRANAGDSRVSESYGLVMVTTLWWRLHNYIATALSTMHYDWNDDQLFMEARRITVAILQHITYNEYFPLFIGMDYSKKNDILPGAGYFNGYNSKVNPQIANVVSTAAFRASHGNVAGHIEYRDSALNIVETKEMSEILLTPVDNPLDDIIRGAMLQCAHSEGPSMTDQLRGLMFKRNGIGNDLAAINIQRGRDHGLPGYNKWRKWCGFEPIRDWKQLYEVFSDPYTVDMMRKLYLSVDDIDIWVAIISEKTLPGALVGPTGACIMGRGMKELKIGDRFWYENAGMKNSFNPAQLAAIKKVRFASMICELSDDIYQSQPWALALPGQGNDLQNCNDILNMFPIDLSAWTDEPAPEVPERYCFTNCADSMAGSGAGSGYVSGGGTENDSGWFDVK